MNKNTATQLKFDKVRFRDFREKKLQLTQEEAAIKLGITRQTLSNWEKENGHSPTIKQLNKIGTVYGIAGTFFLVQD